MQYYYYYGRRRSLFSSLQVVLFLALQHFLPVVVSYVPFKMIDTRRQLLLLYRQSYISYSAIRNTEQDTSCRPPCYYKNPQGRWKQRIELAELSIGQKLYGVVVQELVDGKTGPKVWLDCGVGRWKDGKRWNIQTAMLRLPGGKPSVTAKRIARLRKKKSLTVYVSRIRPENDQFEVCLELEDVKMYQANKKVPVSSLRVGQEVEGTVKRLEPYGALIDVGASRRGLLHIQKVADLYGYYIDKATGLEEAGIERNARLRLKVVSTDKKRLFLDFTDDVKRQAGTDEGTRNENSTYEPSSAAAANFQLSDEEAAAWANYAATTVSTPTASTATQVEQTTDEDDDYDEDREIEDALGLGTY